MFCSKKKLKNSHNFKQSKNKIWFKNNKRKKLKKKINNNTNKLRYIDDNCCDCCCDLSSERTISFDKVVIKNKRKYYYSYKGSTK